MALGCCGTSTWDPMTLQFITMYEYLDSMFHWFKHQGMKHLDSPNYLSDMVFLGCSKTTLIRSYQLLHGICSGIAGTSTPLLVHRTWMVHGMSKWDEWDGPETWCGEEWCRGWNSIMIYNIYLMENILCVWIMSRIIHQSKAQRIKLGILSNLIMSYDTVTMCKGWLPVGVIRV